MVADCQESFSHVGGTLASYIASKMSLNPVLITIVPSIASNISDKLFRTEKRKVKRKIDETA